jgi:hypothetical protein
MIFTDCSPCKEFINHRQKEIFGRSAYCGDPVCHDYDVLVNGTVGVFVFLLCGHVERGLKINVYGIDSS